jgi:ketosteroid isomerase-like protein
MPANDVSDPEVVRVMDRVEEYRRLYDFGLRKFNRDEVIHLYKRDEDFTAYDVAPPVGGFPGWERYTEIWYKVMNKYREIHFRFNDDLRVFRRGDVGWSSVSTAWFGKTVAGEEFRKDLRLTLVWVRENGEWLVTQEHASAPRYTELPSGEKV